MESMIPSQKKYNFIHLNLCMILCCNWKKMCLLKCESATPCIKKFSNIINVDTWRKHWYFHFVFELMLKSQKNNMFNFKAKNDSVIYLLFIWDSGLSCQMFCLTNWCRQSSAIFQYYCNKNCGGVMFLFQFSLQFLCVCVCEKISSVLEAPILVWFSLICCLTARS